MKLCCTFSLPLVLWFATDETSKRGKSAQVMVVIPAERAGAIGMMGGSNP